MRYLQGEQILPAFIRPLEDELFSSWLVRLAHNHYLKPHTFYSIVLPRIHIWNRDIDRSCDQEIIKTLSIKTSIPILEIKKTTLASLESHLFLSHNSKGNTKWVLPAGVYHRDRKNFGLQYCPGCLKNMSQTPYYKKIWRLSLSIACPVCNTYLLDKCFNCQKPICFYRINFGTKNNDFIVPINYCSYCKIDLTKVETLDVDKETILFQKRLYAAISNGYIDNIQYSHLYFEVLHQLLFLLTSKLNKCCELQKTISKKLNIEYIPAQGGYENNFDKLGIEDRIRIMKMANFLLKNWPQNFIETCREIRIYSFMLLRDFMEIPYWYWSVVTNEFKLLYTKWRNPLIKKSLQHSYNYMSEQKRQVLNQQTSLE